MNRINGVPDNWAQAIKIIPPEQPTEEEIEEALTTMVEDAPELANLADDLVGAFEKLLADDKYLPQNIRLQIRNYHAQLCVIHSRAKQLMALMSADWEKAQKEGADEEGPGG